MPASFARPMLGADFSRTALYREMAERCGIEPRGGDEEIDAVVLTPAEASQLACASGLNGCDPRSLTRLTSSRRGRTTANTTGGAHAGWSAPRLLADRIVDAEGQNPVGGGDRMSARSGCALFSQDRASRVVVSEIGLTSTDPTLGSTRRRAWSVVSAIV